MELCPQDKWLVLATDGVWEFIDPQVCSSVPAALVEEPQQPLVVKLLLQAVKRRFYLWPSTSPAVLHHTPSCFACLLQSGQLQLHTLTRSPATGPVPRRQRLTSWAGARMPRRRAARCARVRSLMRTPGCWPALQCSVLRGSISMFSVNARTVGLHCVHMHCIFPPPLSMLAPPAAAVPTRPPRVALPSASASPHTPASASPPAFLQLVDCAWAKWLQEEEGVVDDITVVAVKLNPV